MAELAGKQINAIIFSRKFFEESYTSIYPCIIQLLCTDPEKRRTWQGYSRSQKKTHLSEHLADLQERTLKNIAEIVAPELSEQCGLSVIKLTLRRAVEDGYLTRKERDEEFHYRKSVFGKLTYENDPKDGSKAFGWNEERKNKRREQLRKVLAENMDLTLYDNSELLLLTRLTENKEYQHPKGTIYAGHPDWKKIRRIMADSGYNRTLHAFNVTYSKIKTGRKKVQNEKRMNNGLVEEDERKRFYT